MSPLAAAASANQWHMCRWLIEVADLHLVGDANMSVHHLVFCVCPARVVLPVSWCRALNRRTCCPNPSLWSWCVIWSFLYRGARALDAVVEPRRAAQAKGSERWRSRRDWVRACVVLDSGAAEIKARLFSALLCDRRLLATGGDGKPPRRFHSPYGCSVTKLL
jgi:hypothetical protein